MTLSAARRTLCLTALGLVASQAVHAQPTPIDWSGLAWMDYAYILSSDAPDLEGSNSFDYRRIYLTADVNLDETVRMRVRLEAQGRATTEAGRPSPFVKDAWIRWRYADSGHRATIGVQPPPLFETTEAVWGYRSLDATILDRSRTRSSRDFGVKLDGPLALGGDLRYAAMVGNGRGVRPEPAGEAGKHVYGQFVYAPQDNPLRATLGADYTARIPVQVQVDGEVEVEAERRSSERVSALLGAVTERGRVGVEGFYLHTDFDRAGLESLDGFGVSVFGVLHTSAKTSVIARYDFIDDDAGQIDTDEHYLLGAVELRPIPALSIMPNVVATIPDGADPTVLARITVAANF